MEIIIEKKEDFFQNCSKIVKKRPIFLTFLKKKSFLNRTLGLKIFYLKPNNLCTKRL